MIRFVKDLAAGLSPSYQPSPGHVSFAARTAHVLGASATSTFTENDNNYGILTWPCSNRARAQHVDAIEKAMFPVFIISLMEMQRAKRLSEYVTSFAAEMEISIGTWPVVMLLLHTGRLNINTQTTVDWIKDITSQFKQLLSVQTRYYVHVLDVHRTHDTLLRIRTSMDDALQNSSIDHSSHAGLQCFDMGVV